MKCQRNRDKLCGPIQIENELDHGYGTSDACSHTEHGVVYGTYMFLCMNMHAILFCWFFFWVWPHKHTHGVHTAQRR